jgi:hypothetical protein
MFSREGLFALGLLIGSLYIWGIVGPIYAFIALISLMIIAQVVVIVLKPLVWFTEWMASRKAAQLEMQEWAMARLRAKKDELPVDLGELEDRGDGVYVTKRTLRR